ncbi:hypothetical protein [Kordiimonas gwangyangensis]|uniref:hypothetical protein n=1 Tax=Kordiimonas gwangyangensis TaxID=288022 RepID=UPI000368E805|nr:hypothetical protein [Kordiimonas gwangyangensis]
MKLDDRTVATFAESLPDIGSTDELLDRMGAEMGDSSRRRLFLLAARLQQLMEDVRTAPPLPFLPTQITYGFIPLNERTQQVVSDIPSGVGSLDRFTFGIDVRFRTPPGVLDEDLQRVVNAIPIAGLAFPVIASAGTISHDGMPPLPGHPSGTGTGTCWTRADNPQKQGWDYGIMTARHVTSRLAQGTPIQLTPSQHHASPVAGYLADAGECGIDAAIIGLDPLEWPSNLARLPMAGPYQHPLAPGDDLTIDSRYMSGTPAKVLSHNPLPHYQGAMVPQRLIMDEHGQRGDSGGLVREARTGAGVGLYCGKIPGGQGQHVGVCQDLFQASRFLEAKLYI